MMKESTWYVYQELAPCSPVRVGLCVAGSPSPGEGGGAQGGVARPRLRAEACFSALPVEPGISQSHRSSASLSQTEEGREMTSIFPSKAGLPILKPTGNTASKSVTESLRSLRREGCDSEVGQGLCGEPKK